LLSTGFIYEVLKDSPNSIALSQHWISNNAEVKSQIGLYMNYIRESDVYGEHWLFTNSINDVRVYGDIKSEISYPMAIIGTNTTKQLSIITNHTIDLDGSYIYLGYVNNKYHVILEYISSGSGFKWDIYNSSRIQPAIDDKNLIYTNGNAMTYADGSLKLVEINETGITNRWTRE
jgi:Predicted membrane protein (DUF2206).